MSTATVESAVVGRTGQVTGRPIFVVGAPRSGTSMMQWALRQHADLWGGQESDYLVPLVEGLREAFAYGSQRGKLHWLSGQGVTWPEFARSIGHGVNALYLSRSGGRRWVEQTPQYTHHLDAIRELLPGAVFLCMVRDGRAVVESLKNFVVPMGHEEASWTWRRSIEAGLRFRGGPDGSAMHEVRYEELVRDPRSALTRIYDFLELPLAEESVAFVTAGDPINSSFPGEAGRDKLAPRWAHWTDDEREQFEAIAGDLLREMGYAS